MPRTSPKAAALRQTARHIVRKAGFAPWRALIDRAVDLLNVGHSERFAVTLLRGSTCRLPGMIRIPEMQMPQAVCLER